MAPGGEASTSWSLSGFRNNRRALYLEGRLDRAKNGSLPLRG